MIIKGHEFPEFKVQGSSSRRAIQFRNDIFANLKKIGVHEDDIMIKMETVAIKKVQAAVSWYFDNQHLFFSYNKFNFVGNLYVISKVIKFETDALLNNEKTAQQFTADFAEDEDILQERKDARKLLDVTDNCLDLEEINKKYKLLAKKHHPDKGGDTEDFKIINNAHKLLKRELCP
ncbi:J domain-containing protein [archaeon]|jgi:hypothetical protein|nr:J domain-containing protein [archaeon]MBT3450608.1 J domain-containing protein [archaeon]MBT6868706.1 J domain-containing protein [archaeon]MBT7193494.1 J domain-containing protein [archaeon]MBT7381085.1 J domain-containing protein [archaeon]